MACTQDEKGLCSGYVSFERTPSCEKKRHTLGAGTAVANKPPAKRLADLEPPPHFFPLICPTTLARCYLAHFFEEQKEEGWKHSLARKQDGTARLEE